MNFFKLWHKNLCDIQIKKIAIGNKTKREIVNYPDSHSVGVMIYTTMNNCSEKIHEFLYKLYSDKKQMTILLYKDKINPLILKHECLTFTHKDCNWLGNSSNADCLKFINNKFDILYCINDALPMPFEYILASSLAKFRIGRFLDNKDFLFDFMIDTKKDTSIGFLIDQILHFSKIITNDIKKNESK